MSIPDEPDDSLSSNKEADLRAYRRITAAIDGGDIDEMAAALGQVPDPAWPAPASQPGRNESTGLWNGLRRLTARLQPRRQV
jgi:hypothetical protein